MIATAIRARFPDVATELVRITTRGDTVQDRPLSEIGGSGLFIREIEDALRARTIDIAVHSAKDLPSELPADMEIPAFVARADAHDVLIASSGPMQLDALPAGARLGTSSPRRQCQLRALRKDLDLASIRGNVDTRLRKLDAGEFDAIVLAAAGLARLGVTDPRSVALPYDVMLPAVAQGALAIELRRDDVDVSAFVSPLHDDDTGDAVIAERAFLRATGGGCNTAVAALAQIDGGTLHLTGLIGAPDGQLVRADRHGPRADGESIGRDLALSLLEAGGRALLQL